MMADDNDGDMGGGSPPSPAKMPKGIPLTELTNSEPFKWTKQATIALVDEVQKAEAHIAPHGQKTSMWKNVLKAMQDRNYSVQNSRTLQQRFAFLVERTPKMDPDNESEMSDGTADMWCQMQDMLVAMNKHQQEAAGKKEKKQNEALLVKEGKDLREKSAIMVIGDEVAKPGGSKFELTKDGKVLAVDKDGKKIELSNNSNKTTSGGPPRKKLRTGELLEKLLKQGESSRLKREANEAKRLEVENRKVDVMLEEIKVRQEETKASRELQSKQLELQLMLAKAQLAKLTGGPNEPSDT